MLSGIDSNLTAELAGESKNADLRIKLNNKDFDSSESTIGKYFNRKAKYLKELGDGGDKIFLERSN